MTSEDTVAILGGKGMLGTDVANTCRALLDEPIESWQPSMDFEEGINKTIDWYLQNKDWLANVVAGDYQTYYESMYGNR